MNAPIQPITPILINLADLYTADQAAKWLRTPHRHLDGQTPEAVIDTGGYDRVLELTQKIAAGNYL
jgi:uncharacterized protein (DUF2384 family)